MASGTETGSVPASFPRRPPIRAILLCLLAATLLAVTCGLWLGAKALKMKSELEKAAALVPELTTSVLSNRVDEDLSTFEALRSHTSTAREISEDPLWAAASALPWVGTNFSAASEVARSADDIAVAGVRPLLEVASSLDWNTLVPGSPNADLATVAKASPRIATAAHAVSISTERLQSIKTNHLLPQLAGPLAEAIRQLRDASKLLDTAADVSRLAPVMMGTSEKREYLLIIQNNAELRATGGITGAVAVLTFDAGNMSLSDHSSAGDVGVMSPTIPISAEQEAIYTKRVGKYLQDVTLTPDFPTAAQTAHAMWKASKGNTVDGVISLDPVALSYILEATGPVAVDPTGPLGLLPEKLPVSLTADNVVDTLLSRVYAEIEDPARQDEYFAGIAREVFQALSTGSPEPKLLIDAIAKGAREGRVLLWSGKQTEQDALSKYPVSGSIAGPSVAPAQFGVYFNDGTGAKMDYYVKRTVQLVKQCPKNGYEQSVVRITSTNTAPSDSASSLPAYVTGNGNFGVTPGSVQTNITAYGPIQASVETAAVDGRRADFAPFFHSSRPVGMLALRLAPGESKTVEFTFGKIVQHMDPSVVVTPTVQPVADVILPTQFLTCR